MTRTYACWIPLLLLSACASVGPSFKIEVSSLADPAPTPGRTYVLLPTQSDQDPNDLQFREFAKYVNGALKRQGYTLAPDVRSADLAVFLAYGVGDPRVHTYSYSVPVYGRIGGETATVDLWTTGPSGTTNTSGTVTSSSRSMKLGTETVTETELHYFRYLVLDAIDLNTFRKSEKVLPVWKSIVTSTGRSSDLRLVFPILVAASEQYLGRNTAKQLSILLTEQDPAVLRVRSASAAGPK
jgi:hypothetical protein